MRIKKGLVLREVCGRHVILGEGLEAIDFNKLLSFNETATWLWEQAQAQGEFTVESLADKLCEEYDVTPRRAELCLDASRHTLAAADSLGERDVCLYLGVPFCPTRCAYCSFVSQSV